MKREKRERERAKVVMFVKVGGEVVRNLVRFVRPVRPSKTAQVPLFLLPIKASHRQTINHNWSNLSEEVDATINLCTFSCCEIYTYIFYNVK